MNQPAGRLEWIPPQLSLRRSHVYPLMGACAVLACLFALVQQPRWGSQLSTDEYVADTPGDWVEREPEAAPPVEPPAAVEQIESREPEVLAEGFTATQAWNQFDALVGQAVSFEVAAQAGKTYVVVARTIESCDVDAVVNDQVKDTSPSLDALISFNVPSDQAVTVQLPLAASGRSTCPVAYGVYYR